jgi:hypothetical protein
MIVLDWSPNFPVSEIVKCFLILKWWKNSQTFHKKQQMCMLDLLVIRAFLYVY